MCVCLSEYRHFFETFWVRNRKIEKKKNHKSKFHFNYTRLFFRVPNDRKFFFKVFYAVGNKFDVSIKLTDASVYRRP